MPKINFTTSINEVESPENSTDTRKWGVWRLEITGGLDENPRSVIEEAAKTAEMMLNGIPQHKRYPRRHIDVSPES